MKKTVILLLAAVFMLAGCSQKKSSGIISGSNITPAPPEKEDTTDAVYVSKADGNITAVLISVDDANKTIRLREIDEDGTEYTLNYNGATDVRNAYDEIISMRQLDPGEIVDVGFDSSKLKAGYVKVSEEAFKSSGITNFRADYTTDTIMFGSGKYKYDSHLVVVSQGELIDVSQVINKDEVTVWGIGNKIYSVSVDKGHGYVRFTGYNQFIGGTVEIGRSFLYKVSENMMITVPEGEYKMTMTKGSLTGSKTMTVIRDEEILVDFSEYKPEVIKTGTVKFIISPDKAVLYINGKKTDYSDLVELDYGKYSLKVVCDGYDDYSSSLTVDSIYSTKTISLDGETESASSDKTAENSTDADEKTTTSATVAPTEENETEGTGQGNLIIETPAGADVYIDAVYVGQTPLTIKKEPGEHIITFHKNGYATKSYAIDVSYEDADQKLSFPEMNKE